MKISGTEILLLGAILAILLIMAVYVVQTDDMDRSMNDRLLLLEKQSEERATPRIQIQRATVYNTDGEIVIEKIEVPKKGGE